MVHGGVHVNLRAREASWGDGSEATETMIGQARGVHQRGKRPMLSASSTCLRHDGRAEALLPRSPPRERCNDRPTTRMPDRIGVAMGAGGAAVAGGVRGELVRGDLRGSKIVCPVACAASVSGATRVKEPT